MSDQVATKVTDDASEEVLDGETKTVSSNKTQTSTQQTDWEARYKGLQKTYGKLQAQYEELQGKYDQLVGEAEELRQGGQKSTKTASDLQARLTALESEKADLEGKLKTKDLEKERMKLIMDEYPELVGYEVDGLIPTAPDIDSLKPKLDAFKARLAKQIGKTVKEEVQGAGPQKTATKEDNTGHTPEYIYSRLQQLAGYRTPEEEQEYQKLRAEWDEVYKD